jgi:hypothetical protein
MIPIKRSSAWFKLQKWATVNPDDWREEETLIKQLTNDERNEYLRFSWFHNSRTESKHTVCSKCWRAMNLRDLMHHKCYRAPPANPLIIFKFVHASRRHCQFATVFGMWVLKMMGMHKDLVVYIGKMIYWTRSDVFLWAPVFMYTPKRKKWKDKKKWKVYMGHQCDFH